MISSSQCHTGQCQSTNLGENYLDVTVAGIEKCSTALNPTHVYVDHAVLVLFKIQIDEDIEI